MAGRSFRCVLRHFVSKTHRNVLYSKIYFRIYKSIYLRVFRISDLWIKWDISQKIPEVGTTDGKLKNQEKKNGC